MTESQSADAEPPPPPKPDLSRYTGLRTHLALATTEGKEGKQGPAAAGRAAQGCTRQTRSQGCRQNRLQGRPKAHQHHHAVGQDVPAFRGWCMWPLALGEACGMLTGSSALSEEQEAEPTVCACPDRCALRRPATSRLAGCRAAGGRRSIAGRKREGAAGLAWWHRAVCGSLRDSLSRFPERRRSSTRAACVGLVREVGSEGQSGPGASGAHPGPGPAAWRRAAAPVSVGWQPAGAQSARAPANTLQGTAVPAPCIAVGTRFPSRPVSPVPVRLSSRLCLSPPRSPGLSAPGSAPVLGAGGQGSAWRFLPARPRGAGRG